MSSCRDIHLKRLNLIFAFRKLGFKSLQSFYNVCKSIDATINGFRLIEFYKHGNVPVEFVNKLDAILTQLKYE